MWDPHQLNLAHLLTRNLPVVPCGVCGRFSDRAPSLLPSRPNAHPWDLSLSKPPWALSAGQLKAPASQNPQFTQCRLSHSLLQLPCTTHSPIQNSAADACPVCGSHRLIGCNFLKWGVLLNQPHFASSGSSQKLSLLTDWWKKWSRDDRLQAQFCD